MESLFLELRMTADLAHDDVVELCFNIGYFSTDQEFNKRLFGGIHAIFLRRMTDMLETQRKELTGEFARMLAEKRKVLTQGSCN